MPNKNDSVSPGILRMLGKRAAALYCDCGTPLTDAVYEIVKEAQTSFTKEQVKRICEFANHAAWKEMFDQPGDKLAGFEGGPADAEAVYEKLNDPGKAPPPIKLAHSDYTRRPSELLRAPILDSPDPRDLFHNIKTAASPDGQLLQRIEKLGEFGDSPKDLYRQVYFGFKEKLEQMTDKLTKLAQQHAAATRKFIDAALEEMQTGTPFEEILTAIKPLGPEPWVKTAAFDLLLPIAKDYGVTQDLPEDLFEKVAMSPLDILNKDHEIVKSFITMVKTAEAGFALQKTILTHLPKLREMRAKLTGHEKTAWYPHPPTWFATPGYWRPPQWGYGTKSFGKDLLQKIKQVGGGVKRFIQEDPWTAGVVGTGMYFFGPDLWERMRRGAHETMQKAHAAIRGDSLPHLPHGYYNQ